MQEPCSSDHPKIKTNKLYTAIVEYNSCDRCGGTGSANGVECVICNGDLIASAVIQVEAENLDCAIGKIKYKLTEEYNYEDDPESFDEKPVSVKGVNNVWCTDLLDKNDKYYLINIVKTQRKRKKD